MRRRGGAELRRYGAAEVWRCGAQRCGGAEVQFLRRSLSCFCLNYPLLNTSLYVTFSISITEYLKVSLRQNKDRSFTIILYGSIGFET